MMHMACCPRDDAATQAIGAALARALPNPPPPRALRVYLHGDLGAGKTTLVRGLLRARGVTGAVKSPTYGLLEAYTLPPWQVLHLDLYRLVDALDVDGLGLADHDQPFVLWLVEWPERAAGVLPQADLDLQFEAAADRHRVTLRALSAAGEAWLAQASREPEFSAAGC